jgi:hypothetical protein
MKKLIRSIATIAALSTAVIIDGSEYKIDAEKGWNKVYFRAKLLADQSSETYSTTDLSKIPEGLKWIVDE